MRTAGLVLGSALTVVGCPGKHITEEQTDYEASARNVCIWQEQCLDEFDREFQSVEHCVQLELYRHHEPEACLRANEAFKTCMTELTCEEFREIRPELDALENGEDAGVPDNLPCLLDFFFYHEACSEWTCSNGQVIERQGVCNREDDCADRTDETLCPQPDQL